MKKALALFAIVLTLGMTTAMDAEAKRLGGGGSAGMQRQNVAPPPANRGAPTQASPGQTAPAAGTAAAAAAPAAAAAATKRSWMGPLAGLAAGLGLAALASHFGFGEGLANMMMIGLLVMGVLLVVGMIMRKRAAAQGGPTLAGAGASGGPSAGGMFRTGDDHAQQAGGSMIGTGIGAGVTGVAVAATTGNIPAGFDTAAFVRNAKEQFMALQKANDARDMDRLRDYLTPEMLELARADLDTRGGAPQTTEVFGLDAQVLDVAEEADRYVVSVRFTGSTRDQHGAVPEDLDEIWHLTKPRSGFGGWVIAGIQQTAA
ncbi:MAG: TIM44-like domain-containing protein [Pseudomonadota bacterium]